MDTVGFTSHDHSVCISECVRKVDAECTRAGLQLTPVRRRVLEILLNEHRALGAYDILDTLRQEGMGSQPPVAYRALDFLVANGFAHRIERLNAFVACVCPGETHAPAFLICSNCTAVAETLSDPLQRRMRQTAKEAGFQIDGMVLEAKGLCQSCLEQTA